MSDEVATDMFGEITMQVLADEMRHQELRVAMLIRPKPRWLPKAVWRRAVARTVHLVEFNAAGAAWVYPWAPGTDGDHAAKEAKAIRSEEKLRVRREIDTQRGDTSEQ